MPSSSAFLYAASKSSTSRAKWCRGVLVQEEVELQVPDAQPAHRAGEVGRRDLFHPEEVLVEADRLFQVGGADADVGEPSGPHAIYIGMMETVFHAE
jgi:hypothetical protein